jgi:hypothetical protein
MTPPRSSRLLRSSVLVVLGLAAVACSAPDSGSLSSVARRHTPTSSGSSGSNTGGGTSEGSGVAGGNGSSSNGATSGNGSTGSGGGLDQGTGGGSGSGGGTQTPPAPATPDFTVALDNSSPTLNLADQQVLNVTVTPNNAWTGAVTLAITGLASDVTATFDNATVNLNGAPASAKLTLKSQSSTAPGPQSFQITGTAGSVTKNASANLAVASSLTISIPVNIDATNANFGTFNIKAPQDIANNPVTINFLNTDSSPHEIHADNAAQGFPHGQGTFGPGQQDTPRKVIAAGTYNFHLHDTNQDFGTIVIQ